MLLKNGYCYPSYRVYEEAQDRYRDNTGLNWIEPYINDLNKIVDKIEAETFCLKSTEFQYKANYDLVKMKSSLQYLQGALGVVIDPKERREPFLTAYYNAVKFCRGQIPPAELVFEQLSKLLKRASFRGINVDAWKEYIR